MYFKINNVDYSHLVSGLKVGYENLFSDNSGRNAQGTMSLDYQTTKIKLYVTFRHTTVAEMRSLLGTIKFENGIKSLTVTFLDPRTNALKTIEAYTGTAEPEYYSISDKTIYKPMSLNFIEL